MKLVSVTCHKNYPVFHLIKNITDMYMFFIFAIFATRMTKIKRLKYCNHFTFNGWASVLFRFFGGKQLLLNKVNAVYSCMKNIPRYPNSNLLLTSWKIIFHQIFFTQLKYKPLQNYKIYIEGSLFYWILFFKT